MAANPVSPATENPSVPKRILTACLCLPAWVLLFVCLPFLVVSGVGCWAAWNCISYLSGNGTSALNISLKNPS